MTGKRLISAAGAYLLRVGDAFSQLLNVTIFLGKNPNESVSGRSFRCQDAIFWSVMRSIIDFMFKPWTPHHCQDAFLADLERAREFVDAPNK